VRRLLLFACCLPALAPVGAEAATVSLANGKLTVTAGPGESNSVQLDRDATGFSVVDNGRTAPTAGAGCQQATDLATVTCALSSSAKASATVALGNGNDLFAWTGGKVTIVVRGGAKPVGVRLNFP
jgi:hypothetical protein